MKICRFTLAGDAANPRVGIADDQGVRDVTEVTRHLPDLSWPLAYGDHFIAHLQDLVPHMKDLAQSRPVIALDSICLLSPVANPAKVICGAGNWQEHGVPFGTFGLMGKAVTAMCGAGTPVELRWPDRTTVYEPELGIVIGRQCSNVSEEEALQFVAGYTCAFDTTLQPEKEDWAFCKSFDTYGTLGPWLVTADEIGDPASLSYRFWLDGELRGERSFAHLTGDPARMIAYASSAMTLYPGDILLSGAVDVAPVLPGQTMTIEIDGIGRMAVPVKVSANS